MEHDSGVGVKLIVYLAYIIPRSVRTCYDRLGGNVTGCLRSLWLGWVSRSLCPIKNIFCGKKVAPNATFNLFFLGWGWPWVGEFVGFIGSEFGKSQTP